jgi:hypothetical protein
LVQPALEFGEGDEDAASAADGAELAEDMLVEVVAADAEHFGGLVGTDGEAGEISLSLSRGPRRRGAFDSLEELE